MIALQDLIRAVEANAARVNVYKQPGDGSNGECDCIGLIIGAKRLAGGKWTGTHGSNYAFRSEMTDTGVIKSASDLFIGEVVYKAIEPGGEGYDLPAKYQKGGASYNGDLRDYYHVGVVTSINPLEITHCTSPGPIKRDTKLGKWKYGGRLKGVDYGSIVTPNQQGGTEEVIDSMKVGYVAGGNTNVGINMRAKPSTGGKIIAEIPQNSMVEILSDDGNWTKVTYAGKTGYVMSKFVNDSPVIDNEPITIDEMVPTSELNQILELLNNMRERLEDIEKRVYKLENQVGFG